MSAFDRRSVLLGGATALSGTVFGGALAACRDDPREEKPTASAESAAAKDVSLTEVLPILIAVADQLMPTDELGPGVKQAGIEGYLQQTLADPRMKSIKSLVTRGAVFLGRASRQEHGKAFWELDAKDRESFIGRFARKEVRPSGFTPQAVVRVMLALTLECFLGDPRHGGNQGEVGWQFIGGVDWAGRSAPK